MNKEYTIPALFFALPLVISLVCKGPVPQTPTPTVDVFQAIELTAGAASTQTAAAHPTNTLITIPTDTATLAPINTPTLAPINNPTEFPTFTPVPPLELLPTATLAVFLPTQEPPAAGPCSCSGNTLNCGDFGNDQARAQACYDYCVSQGRGDIHKLDGDNDGSACEG